MRPRLFLRRPPSDFPPVLLDDGEVRSRRRCDLDRDKERFAANLLRERPDAFLIRLGRRGG